MIKTLEHCLLVLCLSVSVLAMAAEETHSKAIAIEPVIAGLSRLDLDLFDAVESGQTALAKKLIDKGANVNAVRKPWRMTPLLNATQGNTDMARMLIKNGANINAADREGSTVLIKATQTDSQDIVRILLENGVDIDAHDRFNETALVSAIVLGHTGIVKMLIEHKADLNFTRYDGSTPLALANNIVASVEELAVPAIMKHDLSRDHEHHHGSPAFITKTDLLYQRKEIVKMLADAGAVAKNVAVDKARSVKHH